MKTFEDLKFTERKELRGEVIIPSQATLFFKNGYGVNVVAEVDSYSVAVLEGNEKRACICSLYPFSISNLNPSMVSQFMEEVQEL